MPHSLLSRERRVSIKLRVVPIDSSSTTRWSKRVGETGAEKLLKETIQAGLRQKLIKASQVVCVNVDPTVVEKNVRHPTDDRLHDWARAREARPNLSTLSSI